MYYTESHEWMVVDQQGIGTVGITDHAQKELGDIVFVELPKIGKVVQKGDEVAVLESTKSAVDIYSPVSGQIIAINEVLQEMPEKVNHAAQSEGWLFKVRLSNLEELQQLMDESAYRKMQEP